MRHDHADFCVTILLPAFFRHMSEENLRFLRRALESVREQEFPGSFEILIIDDGSPSPIESHRDALGPAASDNVRWIRCDRNRGLVHALNRGLVEARYPFIARLDADDRWLPTKIKKQSELFAADPDLTITATGMTLVDPKGKPIETHIRPGRWNETLRFFIDVGCPFPHGSVVARRDIYRLLGGYPHDPTFSHCEDFALWGTWLRFFKPAMVEEALYDYTISPSSVSARHTEQQRKATSLVNMRFRSLNLVDRLPNALMQFAEAIDRPLFEASILAYRMWRFGLAVRLPPSAIEPLRIIMPDREVVSTDSGRVRTLNLADALAGIGRGCVQDAAFGTVFLAQP